jgi:hypothetical protein
VYLATLPFTTIVADHRPSLSGLVGPEGIHLAPLALVDDAGRLASDCECAAVGMAIA